MVQTACAPALAAAIHAAHARPRSPRARARSLAPEPTLPHVRRQDHWPRRDKIENARLFSSWELEGLLTHR
eukprot:3424017-Prymnesium_polylepis.1